MTTIAPSGAGGVRRGVSYWLRGYAAMVRYDFLSLRVSAPFIVLIQGLMGAGMAIIYGFYIGELPTEAALFIATGTPVLALIPVGFAQVPGHIGNQKLEGTYDFTWSLPVPRSASVASTFTVFTTMGIPGTIVALVVAAWRYDLDLHISLAVIPAFLLTALMATSVGAGMGHAIPDPRMTNLIVNLIIFFVIMYSPIAFPIEQFPGWLAAIHEVLPFHHMASVIRAAVTDGLIEDVARSYVIFDAWTILGWATTAWVVGRRR